MTKRVWLINNSKKSDSSYSFCFLFSRLQIKYTIDCGILGIINKFWMCNSGVPLTIVCLSLLKIEKSIKIYSLLSWKECVCVYIYIVEAKVSNRWSLIIYKFTSDFSTQHRQIENFSHINSLNNFMIRDDDWIRIWYLML